jgi:hypothetical protein
VADAVAERTNGHGELIGGRTWKIPPVAVPADDCVVHVGRTFKDGEDGKREIDNEGTPAYWHTGETVWVLPVTNMDAWLSIIAMNDANELDVTDARRPKAMQASFERQSDVLARYIAGWDWTDLAGDPLPQPYKNPDVLRQLDSEEFSYLLDLVTGGPPKEQEAFLADSPATSSTTDQPPERPSRAGSAKRSTAPPQ